VVLWDRRTGEARHRAIVWQDRRGAPQCEALEAAGHLDLVRSRTGLVLDPYFSATKLAWLLDSVPGARAAAAAGRLAFGTVDAWLIWNLTGGVHATDASNASRTLLYGLETGAWDEDLLRLFDVPAEMLPRIGASAEVYGETAAHLLGASIPIAGVAGDQQAALFGQAWRLDGRTDFALEGSVFVAGAAVQWLRDGLGLFRAAADVEALAAGVADSGGVVLVPAFTGLGAPHWQAGARGALLGLTRGTSAAHIARAALEGIAHQVADVLGAMAADLAGLHGAAAREAGGGGSLAELRVDGGAAGNDLLLQIQADLTGIPVVRPRERETTALGAAYLAGLAVGVFRDLDEIAARWRPERRFEPAAPAGWREEARARWAEAVRATLAAPAG
jgi:glycerol kinase